MRSPSKPLLLAVLIPSTFVLLWSTRHLRAPDSTSLLAQPLEVYDLTTKDTTFLILRATKTGTYAFLTPRCLVCLRHFNEIVAAMAILPGDAHVIGPTVAEAAELLWFKPSARVLATLDSSELRVAGIAAYPTIVHVRRGRLRFVWHGLPRPVEVRLAAWLPFYRWTAGRQWRQPLLQPEDSTA